MNPVKQPKNEKGNQVIRHREAARPADRWDDAVLVRAFAPRMVCTVCGIVGADARPNWREMQASGNWRTEPIVTT